MPEDASASTDGVTVAQLYGMAATAWAACHLWSSWISASSTPKAAWGHHQPFLIQVALTTAMSEAKMEMIAGLMVIGRTPPKRGIESR